MSRRKTSRPRLAPWLHEAVRQAIPLGSHVHLRVRLRGNTLHLLCETNCPTEKEEIAGAIMQAIRSSKPPLVLLTPEPSDPIYRLIVYGRLEGTENSLWVNSINILELLEEPQIIAPNDTEQLLVTYQSLARSGAPEAIARYLSDCFSHLGVGIQADVQTYPATKSEPESKRLWITCQCDYSPEYALLTEPLVQELRELQIDGFRDGVIRCQIRGEQKPEWLLWVDLTPPQTMLRDWGRWGDTQAIAHLLNQGMVAHGIAVKVSQKNETLHVFCYPIDPLEDEGLNKQTALQVAIPILEDLAPQGQMSATIYGTLSDDTKPLWVEWLPLAAQDIEKLQTSPQDLAKQGNLDALLFLMQRLLNPHLSDRLATGGIRVKLFTKGKILHVMTEAIACPTKDQVVETLIPFFKELDSPQIEGIRLYGRRSGQVKAVWQHRIDLVEVPAAFKENLGEGITEDELLDSTTAISPEELRQQQYAPTVLEELSQTLRTVLCATKLWTPEQNISSPVLSKQYQQPSNVPLLTDKGVRVALVWGFLGLLLTVQIDWLTGQWLQNNAPEEPDFAAASELDIALSQPIDFEEVEFPDLSLQKSEFLDQETAGFTAAGTTELTLAPKTELAKLTTAPKAIAPPDKAEHPSFNSPMLDEKLALYQKRVQENGVPDILIVGSSRALRGLDPFALQTALVKQGYPKLDIFNFGLNGATVQVFDLLLRQIIPADQLPQMIIWADGSRAFNSGRKDITFDIITQSEGFQKLQDGTFPNLFIRKDEAIATDTEAEAQEPFDLDREANQFLAELSVVYEQKETLKTNLIEQVFPQFDALEPLNAVELPEGDSIENEVRTLEVQGETINLDGFLALSRQFEPDYYYRYHPRVTGYYDNDYSEFNLEGEQHQAFTELLRYLAAHQVNLVVINQPLTDQYLDPVREEYEATFRNYMDQISTQKNLAFLDFVSKENWQQRYKYFSDPSHLNRFGASQVARQLAKDPMLQWPIQANYQDTESVPE
ncbi:SGNH/GDSL hydrolase family protein [[Leptolyngbya] sp. PCC 7376]|uniref:SGNH/GDSL hydrolase family protein n=1 Tax=[Leptolyngbya] sp. PCC 7376 TaxID=111781 RepID=UPI00135C76DB|nr:SGNH/GDSL hydrolase family protein [[Leptolyngbya] sp. PCC 7376]